MKKYLKLMRVKHYIKNLLVFAPLIFNGSLFDAEKLKSTLLGWLSFSLVASAIYIVNDIRDAEKDRRHPTKKERPIASGAVSVKHAVCLFLVLGLGALGINWLAGGMGGAVFYLILYFLVNIFYSMGLKNEPILDIALLTSGFLIRVLYGSALTGIEVSYWLYLTVVSMAFYLVLGKRRNEFMQQSGNDTRHVLKYYTLPFLDKHMYMCLSLTIVFYTLWTMESGNRILVLTVPVVLLICMKYNLDVEGTSDGDPVEVLFGDKMLVLMCGLYGILLLSALYFL